MRKISIILVLISMLGIFATPVCAADINEITATSALLIEADTGKLLFERNADEKKPPASITKIMTMLIIMEELDKGNISLTDEVTVSESAATQTGSHIFLAAGEVMTVNDLLKGIAVASGNDASIAMAEFISGTEEKFVERMNQRASELGMENTHFVNSNGLDTDGHYSSARDISIMTMELMKHPKIFDYTTIWTDTLRGGTFGLANTNKLIRFYEGANGMKTGSTSKAGYCLSATAKRDDMQLIAVVMNSETTQKRFSDASTLLNYGFNTYSRKILCEGGKVCGYINVEKGRTLTVPAVVSEDFSAVVEKGAADSIKTETVLPESVKAPIKKGDCLGKLVFTQNSEKLGEVNITAGEDVKKITVWYAFTQLLKSFFKV